MFRKQITLLVAMGLAAGVACGCSGGIKRPPLGKVKGTITYKGEPVSGAVVNFIMDGAPRVATGTTDSSGNFTLSSYNTDDGAVIGTHKVTIAKADASVEKYAKYSPADLATKGPPPITGKGAIPAIYADVKTTPLKNTVDPGVNEINIELKD